MREEKPVEIYVSADFLLYLQCVQKSTSMTAISLTSLVRRMQPGEETVGGPVDVAVISKGDGFVWINRKHYFKPELNASFFSNYFN